MIAILAEKPSVAASIANVLGANAKKDGYFEGNGYVVTFAFGHLLTLYDAKDYKEEWGLWSVDNLPIIPDQFQYKIVDDSGVKKQFKVINSLFNRPDVKYIVNGCDGDREGELIFSIIYQATGSTKPVRRLWISSHTPKDIHDGMANLREDSSMKTLQKAAYCRQQADWILGINFSIATTKLYSVGKTVLKVGRVILPTVYLIYLRDMEIKNFKPKDYFELKTRFKANTGEYEGILIKDDQTQFERPDDLREISRSLQGSTGRIRSIDKKSSSQGPQKLFNLSDLQGHITSTYDGYTAQMVLKIAQSLYEKRYITYPRTESRYLDDTQKTQAKEALEAVRSQFPDAELQFNENSRIFDSSKVDSHPALTPTYIVPKEGDLTPEEKTVYDEIKKRFVSHFAPPARYENTEIITDCNGHIFRTRGKRLIDPGWLTVYGRPAPLSQSQSAEGDEDEPDLNVDLNEGESVQVRKADVRTKTSVPPKPHTVKSLLKAMETCGKVSDQEGEGLEDSVLPGFTVGTAATRSDVINKIIKVGYVKQSGKSLRITPMGISLMELFPLKDMLEPTYTGRLERLLKEIELGQYDPDKFMAGISKLTSAGIDKMKTVDGRIAKASQEPLGKCPECGNNVVENAKAFGCEGFREGCRFTIWKDNALLQKYGITKVPKTLVRDLLAKKDPVKFKLSAKTIQVSLSKTDKGYWNLVFDFDSMEYTIIGPCPEPNCGGDVVESSSFYGCRKCNFKLWKNDRFFEYFGKKSLPLATAKSLLKTKSAKVKGLVSPKNKKTFDADILLFKNDKGFWGFQFKEKSPLV
jgi:DNA topoisomerase-3